MEETGVEPGTKVPPAFHRALALLQTGSKNNWRLPVQLSERKMNTEDHPSINKYDTIKKRLGSSKNKKIYIYSDQTNSELRVILPK